MDVQVFEAYLKQTQQIAQRLPSDPSALLDIMQLIEKHRLLIENETYDWEEFFKGESTFYSGQYERALQHYLHAKNVPHYHFFCFRTSCFVARARGNQDQAIKFAKKALKLNSNDEILKQFLHDLNTVSTHRLAESIPKISLGEKEIAELASIFEENPRQQQELFAGEFNASKSSRPINAFTGIEEGGDSFRAESLVALEEKPDFLASVSSKTLAPAKMAAVPASSAQVAGQEERFEDRLYAESRNTESAQNSSLDRLKRLAESSVPAQSSLTSPFGKNNDLESKIEAFQELQSKRLQEYLSYTNTRSKVADNALFILNGWSDNLVREVDSSQYANSQGLILTEETRKPSGGLFLRWNGKGIVINPGAGFLNYFHEQGFSLQDIHIVIVTRDDRSAYADVGAIYELNNKLNKLGGQLQIIHYFLNQKAYQELTSILKPNFKQARNTVHSLEVFIDSPDVEKIELDNDIILHYFLASNQESHYRNSQIKGERRHSTTLGIRLELRGTEADKIPTRLGYISGAAWSPLLAHHLGVCDLLVAGFGNTSPADYTKTGYQEDSLGYNGSYSLIEEIVPRLFVSAEFEGREGDIRLEAVKKLREEIANCGRAVLQKTTIVPGDIGLHIDLKTMQIRCPVTGVYVDPANIRIAKSTDLFGRLLYLSPSCYL